MNKYELKRQFNYFLAKHFGIAQDGKTYVLAERTYVYEREMDDDRWYDYEKVVGRQLFPINSKWLTKQHIEFGECSRYRSYITDKIRKRGK